MHLSTRKGPPVEMFSGEDSEKTIDDWLPALRSFSDYEARGTAAEGSTPVFDSGPSRGV